MSKERPILFNDEMVRAIIGGRKTQTRRIVKPQPTLSKRTGFNWKNRAYGLGMDDAETKRNFFDACKYGAAGDKLWVREAIDIIKGQTDAYPVIGIDYRASHPREKPDQSLYPGMPDCIHSQWRTKDEWGTRKWKPSIYMPRWASRIELIITKVRIERLLDITEGDALDEGYPSHEIRDIGTLGGPLSWYRDLWEKINGAGSWDQNPYVWVIEFGCQKIC